MRNAIFFILVLVFLSACSRKESVRIHQNNGLTLIDSSSFGKDLLEFDSNNPTYYPVYYIGSETDTITLGAKPISIFFNQKDTIYYNARNWASPKNINIKISVDTTMHTSYEAMYYHEDENDNNKEVLDSTKALLAFPIIIKNNSDSLIQVGSHNAVGYLTKEVKDSAGHWFQIEKPISYYCGTAKKQLIMEPQDVLIAKLLRHKGDVKKECRLKLELRFGTTAIYSNVFIDNFPSLPIKPSTHP